MSEVLWIRSHVQRLMQDVLPPCLGEIVADGDVAFRYGAAACRVTVVAAQPPMVRVFAHAVCGLRPGLKLFRELNAIQRSALSARVLLRDGVVLVSQTLSPIGLTAPVLEQAVVEVSELADEIGPLLAAMFDAVTPFEVDEAS